jgi:hypothetical protein
MPLVKPQHMKSLHTISLQPKTIDTPRIDAIMCMDLAGKGTKEIADELGIQQCRVSIIKGTPLYIQQRETMRQAMKTQFQDKQTDRLISGDPVTMALKDAALRAAQKKIELMENGKSEFVQLAAAGDVLDRAGYKANQDKTVVSVQITEKMADRFEKAITFTTSKHNHTTQHNHTSETPPSNRTPDFGVAQGDTTPLDTN